MLFGKGTYWLAASHVNCICRTLAPCDRVGCWELANVLREIEDSLIRLVVAIYTDTVRTKAGAANMRLSISRKDTFACSKFAIIPLRNKTPTRCQNSCPNPYRSRVVHRQQITSLRQSYDSCLHPTETYPPTHMLHVLWNEKAAHVLGR